ncbi:MAG: hypothetical protein AAB383_01965 [Patescibacteria group bacterium]
MANKSGNLVEVALTSDLQLCTIYSTNKRSMNNKLGIVLVVCVAVGISVYFWQENRISSLLDDNESIRADNEEKSATDNFHYDEDNYAYYGKLVVNGYLTFEERPEAFCEENCPIYTYTFFNVLNTDNEFLDDYIEEQRGNSFVGETSIGLGCIEEDILWRMNDSNEFGMQKYTNSLEESETILNSSSENPITVELERYLYTGGRGAPDCYSHFAQVKVVE